MSEMPKQTPNYEQNETSAAKRLSRREKLAKRAAPLALVAATVGGYTGVKIANDLQYEQVGTVVTTVDSGETPIDAVREGVDEIADVVKFDPNWVNNVVEQGQDVSREIGDTVQPGQEIEVTVKKSGYGNYKVEADPLDPEDK